LLLKEALFLSIKSEFKWGTTEEIAHSRVNHPDRNLFYFLSIFFFYAVKLDQQRKKSKVSREFKLCNA